MHEAAGHLSECQVTREDARHRADGLAGSLQTCRADRDRICGGAGELAEAVANAEKGVAVPGIPGCVSPAQQSAAARVLEGHTTGASLLADLIAYLSGGTDIPPQPRAPSSTTLRALVDRLVGNGRGTPPLVLRRILIDSIERVAPRFWRRLMSGGRLAVDRWLSQDAPLDDALIAEIRSGIAAGRKPSPGTSAPVESAWRGLAVYRDLAGCDRRGSAPRECARALALQRVLENSGPLLVRQRIQEVWRTDCGLPREAILGWFRDLPASSSTIGRSDWQQIAGAARSKLFACYLQSIASQQQPERQAPSFGTWMENRLPGPEGLSDRLWERIDDVHAVHADAALEDTCVRAVDTLSRLDRTTHACELSNGDRRQLLNWYRVHRDGPDDQRSFELQVCARTAEILWTGRRPEIHSVSSHTPTPDELIAASNAPGGAAELRFQCGARRGAPATFPAALRSVVPVVAAAGEDVTAPPWSADAGTGLPLEVARLGRAVTVAGWLHHLFGRGGPCEALGVADAVCRSCASSAPPSSYDCQIVRGLHEEWDRRTRRWSMTATAAGALFILLAWLRAFRRAARTYGPWRRQVRTGLAAIGLRVSADWLRWLAPSREASLAVRLPSTIDWQRWGPRAAVLRTASPSHIRENDVTRAASAAQASNASLALLLHDEGASPDLKAVRGLLEWAAKGTRRAVQILPLATNRLQGARNSGELLDLIEQISIRGNPFDVRGRLVSSSQFFDRERLVSGLIASAEAGQWVTVTGLRRFGKSSLALEVARRLPGPSAYVDLAGFRDELLSSRPPGEVTAALLRYLLSQLHQSALDRYGASAELPDPPTSDDRLESAELLAWLRRFVAGSRKADSGRTPPAFLLILDEIEQALATSPDRIQHGLEVLSTLIGRLRACLFESLGPSECRFGVVFCGAAHPLLWAPLATLGDQSLMGAFQSILVPRLPDEAAQAMMRSLGARQGIRFTDAALDVVVRETAGIPLLARRVGSAVLELYDRERAQQGGLGAVEIGVEGARAALQREEEPGAPLRGWVESEIGDPRTPAGAILRHIAATGEAPSRALVEIGREAVEMSLRSAGLASLLDSPEIQRRAQEAGAFTVRMLVDIGLLLPTGDPVAPAGLTFPDSIVRRVLNSAGRGASG